MAKTRVGLLCCYACLTLVFLTSATAQESVPRELDWQTDYHVGLELAKEQNKPALIDFYADWCGPCRMMDAQVYTDPRVIEALGKFVPIKVDIDRDRKTAFAYGVRSIPRTVVVNVYGEMVGDIVGFMDSEQFLQFVSDTQEYAYKKTGALVVSVPETDDLVPEQPSSSIDPNAELPALLEYLSHKEPQIREEAGQTLIAQDDLEMRQTLARALSHEYLGMRVGAWQVLTTLDAAPQDLYDPWAAKEDRDTAARKVLDHIATETAAEK